MFVLEWSWLLNVIYNSGRAGELEVKEQKSEFQLGEVELVIEARIRRKTAETCLSSHCGIQILQV